MNLKSMTIDELVGLKGRIEAVLTTKVRDERASLESKLNKLSEVDGGRSRAVFGRGTRGKVAPKFQNPDNLQQTWAGRGLKPRWLTAALEAGKNLDDFVINGATAKPAKKKAVRAKRKNGRNRTGTRT